MDNEARGPSRVDRLRGKAVLALDPALKGKVCRAIGQHKEVGQNLGCTSNHKALKSVDFDREQSDGAGKPPV